MSNSSRRTRAHRALGQSSIHPPGVDTAQSASHRQARLEHILLIELQSLVRDEVADPALVAVRFVALNLSADGGHARVVFGVRSSDLHAERELNQSASMALARATGFFRSRLARQLDLKKVPKLSFAFIGLLLEEPGGEPGGEPCLE